MKLPWKLGQQSDDTFKKYNQIQRMLPSCLQVLMSRSGSRESLPGFSYDAGECNGSGVPCNFAACPCVLHSGFPVAERDRLLQLGWHFDIHSYMRADFVCRRNRKRQLCVNASVREHGEFVLCVPGHSSEYPNLEQAECTLPRLVDLVAACVCVCCVCVLRCARAFLCQAFQMYFQAWVSLKRPCNGLLNE